MEDLNFKKALCLLHFLWLAFSGFCQIDEPPLQEIENYIENQEQIIDYTDLLEHLQYNKQHPLNLNAATADELLALRIFNPGQVQAIVLHKQVYGPFKSILELQTIDELDIGILKTIIPYLTTESSLPDLMKFKTYISKSNQSASAIFSANSPVSEGYKILPPNSVPEYLGAPYSLRTKYIMTYNSLFYAGFNLEKDEGELWHRKGQIGIMDFQSLHVFARFKGKLSAIALGDYQIGWGQGLTFSGSFGTGLSAQVLNVKRSGLQLRPYRSFNESQFLRGAAITFKQNKWECTLFFSKKKIDVNMELRIGPQSLNSEKIGRTFLVSGLHRTENELIDRKSANQRIVGVYSNYNRKILNVGVGAIHNSFDFSYEPKLRIDNTQTFRGSSFYKFGLDFSALIKRSQVFGELAVCSNNSSGMIFGVVNSPAVFLDLVVLYRNYMPGFIGINSVGFSAGGETSDEKGTYIGMVLRPSKKVNVSGYFDQSSNKWYRYNIDGLSPACYYLVDFHYQPTKTSLFYLRYKSNLKGNNVGFETYNALQNSEKNNLRVHIEQRISENMALKVRYEITNFRSTATKTTGSLLFLDWAYKRPGFPISYQMRICWFSCPDFNSRIYSTESNIQYQWSVPAFYGEGFKYYLLSKMKVGKRLGAQGRIAFTKYFDKTETGTGNDMVLSNRIWEINVLLSYVFK